MQTDETNPDDFEQETAIEGDPDETEVEATEASDEPTTEDEQESEATEDDVEEVGDDAAEEEAEEGAEPEFAEVEINGKAYKVHPDLKDGIMMHADYTRKTQGVAEEKNAVAAEKASVEAMREATHEELNARAQLLAINQRLEEYQKLGPNDWNAWEDEDPFAAQRGFREFQTLQQQAGQAATFLQEADKRRTETAQQELAKRIQETRSFAAKNIEGWSPELNTKVIDFATKDLGISTNELERSINPVVYKALHLAWVGSQTLAKSKSVKSKPQAQTKPLSKVSPKGTKTQKPIGEMSMSEYADFRNRQERKRASR